MGHGLQLFNASGVEVLNSSEAIARYTGFADIAGATYDPGPPETYTPNTGSFSVPGYVAGETVWFSPVGSAALNPGGAGFDLNTYSLSGGTISYTAYYATRIYYGVY
jgi:hypothetical protein